MKWFSKNKNCLFFSIVFLSAVSIIIISYNSSGISYNNYERINVGMNIDQCKMILGAGQELGRAYLPHDWRGPVVDGEKFFRWEDKRTGKVIWVGVINGLVCDKWYWEPSF